MERHIEADGYNCYDASVTEEGHQKKQEYYEFRRKQIEKAKKG